MLIVASVATGCAQVSVLLLLHRPHIWSNLLQECAALLTVGVCLLRSSQCPSRPDRTLWLQLASAFSLWALAQCTYTVQLAMHRTSQSPSFPDALWLIFAFPLLLVASRSTRPSRLEPTGLLDVAQAGIFFSVLFALVFETRSEISMALAYDVQSVAMVLTLALRYASTDNAADRSFFRDLLFYSVLYAVFSFAGYLGPFHHLPPGSIIDICWPAPFLGFNLIVLIPQRSQSATRSALSSQASLVGVSALGLTVMSMVAAAVLSHHRPLLGILSALGAFGLFAVRTTVREAQVRQAQVRLEQAALYDPLTGLPNRAHMQQMLEDFLQHPDADIGKQVVLSLDLDRFQNVNDGLGHCFGDRVLASVAQRIREAMPENAIVGRHGGDEFVVLLCCADEEQAADYAAKLLQAIRRPLHLDDRMMYLAASIGYVFDTADILAEDLLRDADCALYRAKTLGKDRAELFQPSMRSGVGHSLRLEADLRDAIEAGGLAVQYQPIYSMPDQSLVGFEALARWNHPELGFISPAEFIPVAEETGLIMPLGKQVLRDACFRLQAWNARHGTSLTVNVNVSARQFDDPNLFNDIAQAVRDANLPPRMLKLEITESALLAAHSSVQSVLDGARALGIQICLDDFGTGYSSLSYLLYHPFDVVKIDQSFVRNLDHDAVKTELVRTVIALAANLNKEVVAEGVESSEEMATLNHLNCHMVQGYYLCRPLVPAKVEELLARLADPLTGSVSAAKPFATPADLPERHHLSSARRSHAPVEILPAAGHKPRSSLA